MGSELMIAETPRPVTNTAHVYLETALKGLNVRGMKTRTARVLERFGNEAIAGVKLLTISNDGLVSTFELGKCVVLSGYAANEELRQLCLDFMAGDAKWVEA